MMSIKNEKGSVLVFITLMIVLLLVMVGMGLDTGHLAYIRSQGQPAVDAAALAAVTGVATGSTTEVNNRVAAFDSTNSYLNSPNNPIGSANITYVQYNYDPITKVETIASLGNSITGANGVRVALETTKPGAYGGGASNTQMKSPLFLTPLFNLLGASTKNTTDVSVSAVAVISAAPDLPIATETSLCGTKVGGAYVEQPGTKLLQAGTKDETSGYTTFYINAASKTQIYNLLQGGLNCAGAPAVGIGFCTQLNNGQISSIYDDFQAVFKADQNRCFFIPVVKDGATYNQCSNILDFAKFCPIDGDDGFGLGKTKSADGKGYDKYLYGNMTCGQDPNQSRFAKCQIPRLVRDKVSGM